MKYLCLIYNDEKQLSALAPSDYETLLKDHQAYNQELRRGGHYVASEALQASTTATTVRIRAGKRTVSDGPYAETKEQLGGFYLIEAGDLNEAINLAAKIPCARHGTVEVRPIETLPSFSEAK